MRCTSISRPQRVAVLASLGWQNPSEIEGARLKITRMVGIAGVSGLMVSPALAQSQDSPPQNPSQSGSSTDRPTPPDASTPNRPLSSNRGNQNVQSPQENQNVQSPRENQNVQSPRDNQDVQSPRGKHMGAKRDEVRSAHSG